MSAPKQIKNNSDAFSSVAKNAECSRQLKFITELGKSLLFTVHSKKVALCVAEAIQTETNADICALVVELEHIGLISDAFAANETEEKSDFLQKRRFKKWLELLPPQISGFEEEKEKFLLETEMHRYEYVSPLHINGEVKGALAVGFADKHDSAGIAAKRRSFWEFRLRRFTEG